MSAPTTSLTATSANATNSSTNPTVGGWSESKAPSQTEIEQLKGYKEIVETCAGHKFDTLEPVLFAEQVVAGMNYAIKYKVGDEEYIHVQIYDVPWLNQTEVTGFVDSQALQSPFDWSTGAACAEEPLTSDETEVDEALDGDPADWVGGWSESKAPSQTEIEQLKGYKEIVETCAGHKFDTLEPVLFAEQVVAGMNYAIKYKVGDEEYIHVQIYDVPWLNQTEVTGFVDSQALQSPFDWSTGAACAEEPLTSDETEVDEALDGNSSDPRGGWSESKAPSQTEIEQLKGYKEIVETCAGHKFDTFEPILFAEQVVAGMNYAIKYKVGDDVYINVQIYDVPWLNQIEVTGFVDGQTLQSPFDWSTSAACTPAVMQVTHRSADVSSLAVVLIILGTLFVVGAAAAGFFLFKKRNAREAQFGEPSPTCEAPTRVLAEPLPKQDMDAVCIASTTNANL